MLDAISCRSNPIMESCRKSWRKHVIFQGHSCRKKEWPLSWNMKLRDDMFMGKDEGSMGSLAEKIVIIAAAMGIAELTDGQIKFQEFRRPREGEPEFTDGAKTT